MYCKKCGKEIVEGSKYCPKCGTEIKKAPKKKKIHIKPKTIFIVIFCLPLVASSFFAWKRIQGTQYLAAVKNERGLWGYINANGKEVIACKYAEARDFGENGLATVCINGKWGFINKEDEEVIRCQYDQEKDFEENGLVAVCQDDKWGYINEKGEKVVLCQYEQVGDFGKNGLAAVYKNSKWGYINEDGEEVISRKYTVASDFGINDCAIVRIDKISVGDGKPVFINEEGQEIGRVRIPDDGQYSVYGTPYGERGLLPICGYLGDEMLSEQWGSGFVDEQGEELTGWKYTVVCSFSENGLAAVRTGNGFGCVNDRMEEVIPCQYEEIGLTEPERSLPHSKVVFKKGITKVRTENGWGCIDENGREVIPCKYRDVSYIGDNDLIAVSTRNGCKYLNEKGREVLKLSSEYKDAEAFVCVK